ncbi:hypothetical protein B0H12DRAFT_131577 [Mycena haematopus]|nr:hypothetical protein B0H12DRAFT_131577 [Mycena haematopus]
MFLSLPGFTLQLNPTRWACETLYAVIRGTHKKLLFVAGFDLPVAVRRHRHTDIFRRLVYQHAFSSGFLTYALAAQVSIGRVLLASKILRLRQSHGILNTDDTAQMQLSLPIPFHPEPVDADSRRATLAPALRTPRRAAGQVAGGDTHLH